jgi:hypothetical protein
MIVAIYSGDRQRSRPDSLYRHRQRTGARQLCSRGRGREALIGQKPLAIPGGPWFYRPERKARHIRPQAEDIMIDTSLAPHNLIAEACFCGFMAKLQKGAAEALTLKFGA